jgi:hypothetical protein
MIELTAEQIARAEAALNHIPGAVQKAASSAINRAAQSAMTEAARKARETYYIRHKDVLDTMKIYRATPSDLSAMVVSRGSVIALSRFRITPRKPQPSRAAKARWGKGRAAALVARVKKGEGGPIKRAFMARVKSGHLGVFRRTSKSRYPVEHLHGPSVPQMLGSRSVSEAVEQRAMEQLDKRLDHEIKRALEGDL